jgi:hypothetical protein
MRLCTLAAPLAALALATPAAAATKHGITPIKPLPGSTVPAGKSPTFRMRVAGPGQVWVHVCTSAKPAKDGTICDDASIGRATRRPNGTYAYKPKFFDYETFWLNTPGTYYWQAHRIACEAHGDDCRQEGPVVTFSVV